jgi:hypothetical protein
VGKNSKIQAKNPKIQGVKLVITAKNQKINPFVGALNFWIEFIFLQPKRYIFCDVVWGGRVYI